MEGSFIYYFDHRIVCQSFILGFLLPLWYLQTFLIVSIVIGLLCIIV